MEKLKGLINSWTSLATRSVKEHRVKQVAPIPYHSNFLSVAAICSKKAILTLFNFVFPSCLYPQIWSEGNINPIFKVGNMSQPDNKVQWQW